MAYLEINDIDFSMYVNALKVNKTANYNAQTNAAGNTVVDYINTKRNIEVGIIPLDDEAMAALMAAISGFNVSLRYRDPETAALKAVNAIIPDSNVEYYTIKANNALYKALNLTFIEL